MARHLRHRRPRRRTTSLLGSPARWAGRAVLGAAIACVLVVGVGPRLGLYRLMVVLGPSMGRTLPLGSLVVSTPEPSRDIAVGQIISFHSPVGDHQVETHRVVRVLSGGAHPIVWTRGDANATRDPWTARVDSTTVWRVRGDLPGVGYAIRLLRGPALRALLVGVLPGAWAAIGLWAVWAPTGSPRRRSGRHRPARHRRPRGRPTSPSWTVPTDR